MIKLKWIWLLEATRILELNCDYIIVVQYCVYLFTLYLYLATRVSVYLEPH